MSTRSTVLITFKDEFMQLEKVRVYTNNGVILTEFKGCIVALRQNLYQFVIIYTVSRKVDGFRRKGIRLLTHRRPFFMSLKTSNHKTLKS